MTTFFNENNEIFFTLQDLPVSVKCLPNRFYDLTSPSQGTIAAYNSDPKRDGLFYYSVCKEIQIATRRAEVKIS